MIKINFLAKVFGLMSIGVLITGLVGFFSQSMIELNGMMIIGLFVAQLVLIYAIHKTSNPLMFILFSVFEGLFFGLIFSYYGQSELIMAFISSSSLFAVLAIIGATTKKDLSSWSTIMFAALISLIIVMVINMFLQSSTLMMIITGAGIILFSLLTIYDTNQIKKRGDNQHNIVTGALSLYLDFVNLFLFILRAMFGLGNK